MRIVETIKEISQYFQMTRQAGHTRLMKAGFVNFNGDKYVLCLNIDHGTRMGVRKSEIVSLESLDKLRGSNRPLAIDNGALIEIFDQMDLKMDSLVEETQRHKSKYIWTRDELLISQNKVKDMRSHPFKTFFKTIFKLWQH